LCAGKQFHLFDIFLAGASASGRVGSPFVGARRGCRVAPRFAGIIEYSLRLGVHYRSSVKSKLKFQMADCGKTI
jgi:hypothetical protein